jgi:uncharacterized protein YndB with AHSA1/START domain
MSTITGYKKDTVGAYIDKDPGARLVYSMDWSDWLPTGDTLSTATYVISTITGDAAPIVKHSQGIEGSTVSYVELSGGTAKEIYTVTATITTTDGNTDKRRFRLKVNDRFL